MKPVVKFLQMIIFLIENNEKQGDTFLLLSNFALKYAIMKNHWNA
jgi:hypothetical protein